MDVASRACGSGGGDSEVSQTEFTEWLQTTEMVGPYSAVEADCIAEKMYDGGLTSAEAQEFLDEDDEPSQLDSYTDAAVECQLDGVGDAING